MGKLQCLEIPNLSHLSFSPCKGNVPTQGQRKCLTRVGFEPTTWGIDHPCFTNWATVQYPWHAPVLGPFLKSRKTPACLFCKAGLFICCKGKKNKNKCKVLCLKTPSFWRYKENYVTGKTFERQAPGLVAQLVEHWWEFFFVLVWAHFPYSYQSELTLRRDKLGISKHCNLPFNF